MHVADWCIFTVMWFILLCFDHLFLCAFGGWLTVTNHFCLNIHSFIMTVRPNVYRTIYRIDNVCITLLYRTERDLMDFRSSWDKRFGYIALV